MKIFESILLNANRLLLFFAILLFSLGNIEINDPEFNNNYQYSRGYLIGIKAR